MGVRPRKPLDAMTSAAVAAAYVAPRGVAPTIDCRWDYLLLPPGYGAGYDLVNPGCKISPDASSYNLTIGEGNVKVQVLLYKKAFEIYNSPPATDECKSAIKANGNLSVGWHGDIKNAWRIVLGVLGIREDGRTIAENAGRTSSSKCACHTVANKVGDGSSSSSSSVLPSSSTGLEPSQLDFATKDELECASKVLKNRLLRSELFKQPAGTEEADNIIVEEVMHCVMVESQNVHVIREQAADYTSEPEGDLN